jgi:tetratricopeptide (TPR) repeat protein
MEGLRSWSLGLGLLCGALGCSLRDKHHEFIPPYETAANLRSDRDLPKRQPKASTCVEMGRFQEAEANAPNRTGAEREALLDQARKAYQQALEIDRKNVPAALALGRLYDGRGEHDRAVAMYQKTLKLHPKDPELWGELGMSHARYKEWEPALKCLNKAVELDPENRQASHNLGYCLARAGRYEESLASFTKTDGEAKAHYNLARMLHHLDQDDLCREHLQQAVRKDPYLTSAREMLVQLDNRTQTPGTILPASHEVLTPVPDAGVTEVVPNP